MTADETRNDWTLGGESGVSPRQVRETKHSRRGKRRFARIVIILLISTAVLGSLLWQSVKSQSFPKLLPGMYAGTLRGPVEYGAGSDWLLTISEDYKTLKFFQLGVDGAGSAAQRDSSGYLVVTLPNDTMILMGDGGNTALKGSFRFLQSERTGYWDLRPLSLADNQLDDSFRRWLSLRSELLKVEKDVEIAERLIPVQKAEIDELTKVINDESALKERGANRLNEIQGKMKLLEAESTKKRALLAQAEAQLLLAQRVSLRGKLVNLARESNDRETRWVQSLLSSGGSEDLEGALQRAEEVKALKETLAQERLLVEDLVRKIEGQNKLEGDGSSPEDAGAPQ